METCCHKSAAPPPPPLFRQYSNDNSLSSEIRVVVVDNVKYANYVRGGFFNSTLNQVGTWEWLKREKVVVRYRSLSFLERFFCP